MSGVCKHHSKETQLIDVATHGELWIFTDMPTVWANMNCPSLRIISGLVYVCRTKILWKETFFCAVKSFASVAILYTSGRPVGNGRPWYCGILCYTVVYCDILCYSVVYCSILRYTVIYSYTLIYFTKEFPCYGILLLAIHWPSLRQFCCNVAPSRLLQVPTVLYSQPRSQA